MRLARLVTIASTLELGCLNAHVLTCGDVLCPESDVCVAQNQCATPDSISACDGLAAGADCQSTTTTGYCLNGACVPNVCGDGVVTGNEACDGSDVPVTCANLGYYSGTPTCTPECTITTTGCSGRCGDGIVQQNYGEVCDGSPPTQTCCDYGLDWGDLSCDSVCQPDIANDCFTYGWEVVLSPLPTAGENAAAMNAQGVVALYGTSVRVMWAGVESSRANEAGWTYADADESRLLVANATSLTWFDGSSWHDTDAGATGTAGNALAAGMLYELDTDCAFRAFDLATATEIVLASAPGSSCSQLIASSGELVAVTGADVVAWNGAQWNALGVGSGVSVQRANGGRVWVESLAWLRLVDLQTGTQYDSGMQYPQTVYPDGDGDVFAIFSSPGGEGASIFVSGAQYGAPFPPLQSTGNTSSAEGAAMAFGHGVYRLVPVLGTLFAISNGFNAVQIYALPALSGTGSGSGSSVAPIDDGAVAVCAGNVGWFGGASHSGFVPATGAPACNALVGDPRSSYLVGNSSGVWSSSLGGYEITVAVDQVVGTFADAWAGGSYGSTVEHRVNGSWTTVQLPAGCVLGPIAGGGGQPLYAIAHCASDTLYVYTGASWNEIVVLPTGGSAIAVAADGSVFVSSDVTARVQGNTLVPIAPATPRIVALGANDVYVDLQTGVFDHYINGTLASLRLPSGSLAITPNAYYARDSSTGDVVVLPRMPSSLAGLGP